MSDTKLRVEQLLNDCLDELVKRMHNLNLESPTARSMVAKELTEKLWSKGWTPRYKFVIQDEFPEPQIDTTGIPPNSGTTI